jgi:hypothetical protein
MVCHYYIKSPRPPYLGPLCISKATLSIPLWYFEILLEYRVVPS